MKCLLGLLVLTTCGWWAMADDGPSPPGMNCRNVMIVEYHDGPNVAQFGQYVQGHLDYLRKHMQDGKILHGGPFEKVSGGIALYTVTDPAEVDALVNTDPAIANKVFTYSMREWRMCSPAQKPQLVPKG